MTQPATTLPGADPAAPPSIAPAAAPDAARVPALFQPLRLADLTLANRIAVSPMCQYSAVEGAATDWHVVHLGQLALSGAGLLMIEATAVEPEGRITPGCLGLWDDRTEAALGRVVATVRGATDAPPLVLQVGHAGRKASSGRPWEGGMLIPPAEGGWWPAGPSALPHRPEEPPPRAMSVNDIDRLVDRFVDTTQRAARIGIDGIELHAAHGYLLHQFLSPLANRREDHYGGSLENRMRLTLRVVRAVRDAWPAGRPLGVRISATDWVDGGWDMEQSLALCHALEAEGVDWIDVSSGGVSPAQRIALGPGYQVPFAQAVRAAVRRPAVIAVGLVTQPQQAEDIIAQGQADMVALARALLWNPRWPWHAAAALGTNVAVPRQYWRSEPREHAGVFGTVRFGQR